MQRGGSAPRVEFPVTAGGLVRAQALDGGAAMLELDDHVGIRMQPTVRADTENQPLGQRVEHLIEIVHHKRVAIPAPPVGHDPVGQHDQVPRLLRSVDGYPAEAVILKPRHPPKVPPRSHHQSRVKAGDDLDELA
jgi:hypothetical protein